MTYSTSSLYYQILNAIYNYNIPNMEFPTLHNILDKVTYNSENTRVALNHMKSRGYIKAMSVQPYRYTITEKGIDYIRLVEINEQKNRLTQHYERIYLNED